MLLKALQGRSGVAREELSKLPGVNRVALNNAIFALDGQKVIDRTGAGFVVLDERRAAEIIESTAEYALAGPPKIGRPPKPEPHHEPDAEIPAAMLQFVMPKKPPAHELPPDVNDAPSDPSVLFAINELGEIEVSRRDGEGSVVPIPPSELPRLLKFIDQAAEFRERLLREVAT